jgi:2-polyprenyl-3-methyl-5-hydroxy-6-metoxy-1,4-benzoquinol methylase
MQPHEVVWTGDKIGAFWNFVSSVEAQAQFYFAAIAGNGVATDIARTIDLRDRSVLDFGCGPGHLFPHLARHAPTPSLLRPRLLAQDSIEELKRKWGAHPQFAGGAAIGSFPVTLEREFDVIVCCEVIEHLDDETLEHVCAAFARLLRKGGTLYLSTPNDENLDANSIMCPDCGGVVPPLAAHAERGTRARSSRRWRATASSITGTEELVYAGNWTKRAAV